MAVSRILRFSLTSANPAALARFYTDAFGFTPAGSPSRIDASLYGAACGAVLHRLRLGDQEIELVGFDSAGAPYPAGSTSHDAWFQHLAIVTNDIAGAYARLAAQPGWTSLTRGAAPVALPASSGGVTAFKFRDPEGHPLELLQFPAGSAWPSNATAMGQGGPCLGIDHSAIVVSDSATSLAFYRKLGLSVGAQSENRGAGQERLDDVPEARVEVFGLFPPAAPPHLELLAYHMPSVTQGTNAPADIACTRTIMAAGKGGESGLRRDPDGHRIVLLG